MSQKNKNSGKYITVGPLYFKIRIVFTIITITTFSILAYLGTWQLGRAVKKEEIIADMQEKINGMPQRLSALHNPQLENFRFTPVIVYGVYLNKYTFLLDNQVYKKQPGYRVLTVLQSPYFDKWVLIDRGWISQGSSRAKLPNIIDKYGVQQLIGIINTIPTGIVLEDDKYDPNASWPIVIQSLDFDFIEKNLQHPIYNFVVQLNAKDAAPYSMPPIDFGVPSDKHFGYALQWYTFASLVLLYYFITSFSRRRDN